MVNTCTELITFYKKELEKKVGAPIQINRGETDVSIRFLAPNYNTITFKIELSDYSDIVATFTLTTFPSSRKYCVSHNAVVYSTYTRKGIGTLLNKMRIDIAKQMRFLTLLCTYSVSNIPQKKILEKNGWRDIHIFPTAALAAIDL